MTKYEFLQRARDVHGYKYLYPLLGHKIKLNEYVDVLYKDVLYEQSVSKHLMGRCPEKNIPRKTTESFVKESIEVWGDKYDYSLVEYTGALNKVKIIYDGIVFEQVATSHISGSSPEFRLNKDLFLKKSIEKWGDKYDYSLVKYKGYKSKVKIKFNNIIYEQTPHNHLLYAPEKNVVSKTTNDFINKSLEVHGDKYSYNKTIYTLSKNEVVITCPIHGDFSQVANSHIIGHGCKKCGDKYKNRKYNVRYTTKEFIEECKEIWGDKYDYSITKYVNMRTKIKVIYDGITYDQLPGSHLKYPVEGNLTQEIFLIKANRKWGDKYDYSLVNFKSTKELVDIIYDDKIYQQYPHNHLVYAPEKRNLMYESEFIKKSIELHGDQYFYNNVSYVNSITEVDILCRKHGMFTQKPTLHLRGCGCPICNESMGEKKIRKFLNKNKINFESQHTFTDCKSTNKLRFDFYIPSLRMCIEYDGIQHFEVVNFFGGEESFLKRKKNDEIKNNYCEDNYINLIRIKYDKIDKIEKILSKNLFFIN